MCTQSHFAKHFFVKPVSLVPAGFQRIGTIIFSTGSRKVPVIATHVRGSPARIAAVADRMTNARVLGLCPRGSVDLIQTIDPCSRSEAAIKDEFGALKDDDRRSRTNQVSDSAAHIPGARPSSA